MPSLQKISGTLVQTLSLPQKAPRHGKRKFAELSTKTSRVSVYVLRAHKLLFLLKDLDGNLLAKLTTCPLKVGRIGTPLLLTVIWDLPKRFEISINRTIVASLDKEQKIPNQLEIKFNSNRQKPDLFDYSHRNQAVKRDREQKIAGENLDEAYLVSALKRELAQIQDLLQLMQSGHHHHAYGLATRIRLLLLSGRPLGLIHTCAALKGKPLTVFTYPSAQEPLPDVVAEGFYIDRNLSPLRMEPFVNPIDIGVWLELSGGSLDGEEFTNWQLLKSVGDTVAAHVDPVIDPLVSAIRKQTAQAGPLSSGPADALETMIFKVGETCAILIEELLFGFSLRRNQLLMSNFRTHRRFEM
ncbi:MAG: hypothetical protein GY789_06185 [Hyphomicrobiales bacterium]|nr:hypothetical protein [Hyphomicrobiales bacterium]